MEALGRERLERRIDEASTLVLSTPAGFGKTTLMRQWQVRLEAQGHPTAWIDLERLDDDLAERLQSTQHAVKWRLQHVYEKLGVKSRTGAVLAARERQLLRNA